MPLMQEDSYQFFTNTGQYIILVIAF